MKTVKYDPRPLLATLAAALATVFALGSVVSERTWVPEVYSTMFLVIVVQEIARLLRTPAWLVPVTGLIALLVWLTLRFSSIDAFASALPTWTSLRNLEQQMQAGAAVISSSVPPAAPQPALVALLALILGLVAMLLHISVVLLRNPLLGGAVLLGAHVVPMTVLRDGAPLSSFIMLAAAFTALLASDQRRTLRTFGTSVTVDADAGGTSEPTTRGALGLGVTAVVIAIAVPLVIPGLDEPVWRPGSGGIGGEADGLGAGPGGASLLLDTEVSLRRNLVRKDDVQVLRYRTDDSTPSYLRLTALTRFDGTAWTSQSRQSGATASWPGATGSERTYDISTFGLANRLLPLPYQPQRVTGLRGQWDLDPLTQTVWSAQDTASAQNYSVRAYDDQVTAATLRAITSSELQQQPPVPRSGEQDWLALPATLPRQVSELAQEVTGAAATPFDKALALQNHFRTGYSYSLKVVNDPTTTPLLAFLRDRTGYCEQFAATMAVMARAVGIPARVALGFTSGTKQDDGTWVVTAHDAHAWPELWFPGQGWVRFEPTPRSDEGAGIALPNYAPGPGIDYSGQIPDFAGMGENGGGGRASGQTPGAAEPLTDSAAGAAPASAADPDAWRRTAFGLSVLVLLLVALAPAAVRRVRRIRRIHAMRSDLQALDLAWDELRDTAIDLGVEWNRAQTPRQHERSLATSVGTARHSLARLVHKTEAQCFAGTEPTDLSNELRDVLRGMSHSASRRRRWIAALLPRSLRSQLGQRD